MFTVERSVDVNAPVRTAYHQWTIFESFSRFLAGVEKIEQTTPTRTHWRATVRGMTYEFDAEITEQHPDERVAWRSVSGPEHVGVVTFHPIDAETTRVRLRVEGTLGDVQDDLGKFKEFIENRYHHQQAS
jgi:uncharacterized membrane protein